MTLQHFYTIHDLNLSQLIEKGNAFKKSPFQDGTLKNKSIVTIYLNPSLRTRLSTEKAAHQLGISVTSLNITDAWKWETKPGVTMNLDKAEHIQDAAQVISQYCDLIAIRSFPGLKDRAADLADMILKSFMKYASVPVLNMESAGGHPLQALADAMTIQTFQKSQKPKVVLTWAPHPKALPHAVPISFARMAQMIDTELSVVQPEGYALPGEVTRNARVLYHQDEALKGADFVYVKNWSSTSNYGTVQDQNTSWMIDETKMKLTNEAYVMHCLPVRRNVVISDKVLDSEKALCMAQANNRTYAAQSVLWHLLKQ
jgi:N-succinyl-L-ornithine transcarbamylase